MSWHKPTPIHYSETFRILQVLFSKKSRFIPLFCKICNRRTNQRPFLLKLQFIAQSAKPTMQNGKCKMQNDGVACGDLFQSFPQEIPQFCILHFEFCISCVSTLNCNLHPAQFMPGHAAILRLDLHQNNIRADATDALPGDHIVILPAKQPQKTARPRHDDGLDTPLRRLDLQITDKS